MKDKIVKQKDSKKKRGNPAWEKGTSGNPHGRPKNESSIANILRKFADEKSDFDPDGKQTRLERICLKALTSAEGGDPHARSWVADRMEGRAIDRIIQKFDDDELIIL